MTATDIAKLALALFVTTFVAYGATWEDPPPATVIDMPRGQPQARPHRETRQVVQPAPRPAYRPAPASQPRSYPAPQQVVQPAPQPVYRPAAVQPQERTRQVGQPSQPTRRYIGPSPQREYEHPQRTLSYAEESPEYGTFGEMEGFVPDFQDLYSQHLDADRHPVYTFGVMYTKDTEFGSFGMTDMVEANLEYRLFRFDNFLWGSIDAWAVAHGIYFIDNPGMKAIPDCLLDAGIDLGVWWRFVNGWSTEFRAMPGIFSDITEPAFGIPLTFNMYYAFDPTLSLKLGATYRPGWDIPVMPSLGIAWEPVDVFRLEAMLPKSKVTLFPNHMVSFFGTFEWRNITYALDDSDPAMPDKLTLDDMMISAGVALSPMRDYSIVGEYGMFVGRELSADVETDRAIDLSKEPFFRIMIQGSF
jgi:hypothetical protein